MQTSLSLRPRFVATPNGVPCARRSGPTFRKNVDQKRSLSIIYYISWHSEIDQCIAKANQKIGWIACNIISRESSVMLSIYKSLVRPLLEYAVQVWNPVPRHGNWSTFLDIEGVQRRFTRINDGIGLLPYSERLSILGLTTLGERRCRL